MTATSPDSDSAAGASQGHVELARNALTRHDLGVDGAAWRTWWAQNERRHRIEWLIDIIDSPNLPLYNAAALDLTKLATGYPALAPPEASFLYSPLTWKMWWATVWGQGSRIRIATAPPATKAS
ncbi:MAG: hypothetical protein IPL79_14880 [Myxococcales bacterium]|nr:hypothetical protein [Myxococcales bacterium]